MTNRLPLFADSLGDWYARGRANPAGLPSAPFVTKVGIYNGTPAESPDEGCYSSFGYYPEVANTYYQTTNTVNVSYESARCARGTSPLLTFTAKDTPSYLTDIANHSGAGVTWIQSRIDDINTIATNYPGVTIYVTLDHEFEVKVNQGTITGISNQTYADALSYFFTLVRATCPSNVKVLYWYGYFDTTDIADILSKISVAPDLITLDPYRTSSRSSSEDFLGSTEGNLNWLLANSDYARLGSPAVAYSEYGTDTTFGDSNCAWWFTGNRDDASALGLEFISLFNRDSAGSYYYEIDGGSFPLTVAAFAAELAH